MTRKTIIAVTTIVFVLTVSFLNGCQTAGGTAKPDAKLAAKYLEKGKALEKKDMLPEAFEQYKLALTVDPKNAEAAKKKEDLSKKLSKLAHERYKLGMKYHSQGKYSLASKEFLKALKYQPDHPKASKMLVSRKPDKSPNFVMHKIRPGESLAIIAKKYYGDPKKFDVIARINNIKDPTRVRPGMTIMVPDIVGSIKYKKTYPTTKKATGFVWHTIKPGQSISKLAQIYYGDYKQFHAIAKYNDMDDATRIKVGDRVKVPKIAGLPFNDPHGKTDTDYSTTDKPELPTQQEAPVYLQTEKPVPQTLDPMSEKPASSKSEGNEQALAYRDTGIELYNEGKYEDAIFELNKALEASPRDNLTQTYIAKAYFESGKVLYEKREYEAAREAFESAIQYDPQCGLCKTYIEKTRSGPALAYRAKGIEHLQSNEFAAAIIELEKYLEAKPGDAEGRNLISKAYFQKALIDHSKGAFLDAKKGFELAKEYDPRCKNCAAYVNKSMESFKEAHYNKGLVYYGQQQLVEAVREWEMVHDMDPAYKEVKPNLQKARALLEKLENIKKSRKP